MATSTLIVTATETDVQIVGAPPNTRVSFEIRYHYGPNGVDYYSFGLYQDSDPSGTVALTIPLGSDFCQQTTGQPLAFADGPWFTGAGGLLFARPS